MRQLPFILLPLIVACNGTHASTSTRPDRPGKIRELFAQMREGRWTGRTWPKLDWDDVAALLALADSDVALASFPVNPISSQSQEDCSTGMMALWLIEGIRLQSPNGYPSLNPLCFDAKDSMNQDWDASSLANLPRAASAYRQWWQRVRSLPVSERKTINPLAGSGLAWYGSAAR